MLREFQIEIEKLKKQLEAMGADGDVHTTGTGNNVVVEEVEEVAEETDEDDEPGDEGHSGADGHTSGATKPKSKSKSRKFPTHPPKHPIAPTSSDPTITAALAAELSTKTHLQHK